MAILPESLKTEPKPTPVEGVHWLDMSWKDIEDMDDDSLCFLSVSVDASGNPLPSAKSLQVLEQHVGAEGLAALQEFFQSESGLSWKSTAAKVRASLHDSIRRVCIVGDFSIYPAGRLKWSGSFGQFEGRAKDCFRVGSSPSCWFPILPSLRVCGQSRSGIAPSFARRECSDRSANDGVRPASAKCGRRLL